MTEWIAQPAPGDTRVRVTIEGSIRRINSNGVVRLYTDNGTSSVLLDTDDPAVSVETLAPVMDWRDGDVVQSSDAGWTLTRQGGSWVSSHPNVAAGTWTDEKVSAHLGPNEAAAPGWGGLRVLRYQATELDHAEDD